MMVDFTEKKMMSKWNSILGMSIKGATLNVA
jgi:hypothetical protein